MNFHVYIILDFSLTLEMLQCFVNQNVHVYTNQ